MRRPPFAKASGTYLQNRPSNASLILVIDDDATVRDVVGRFLERKAFRRESQRLWQRGLPRAGIRPR
jgi:hypothetical protein